MKSIEEAVLAAGAGALVKTLVEKLFLRQKPAQSSQTIAGNWHMHWVINQPEAFDPKSIDDLVTLVVDRNGTISGHGENPFYGAYDLTGSDTAHTITLAYRPTNGKTVSNGVCLILKTANISEMNGVWWQHDPKHGLVGGGVVMKRPKSL